MLTIFILEVYYHFLILNSQLLVQFNNKITHIYKENLPVVSQANHATKPEDRQPHYVVVLHFLL